MSIVTIEEAQARLPQLIEELSPEDTVIITRDNHPIARLTVEPALAAPRRILGQQKGSIIYMTPDFDVSLEDFKEYME